MSKSGPSGVKEMSERVKEAVYLLKQLEGLGTGPTDPGYQTLKSEIDLWVRGGSAWSGTILFSRIGRKGTVVLPVRIGTTASIQMKS